MEQPSSPTKINPLSQVGSIIAVSSCKGGVGKSTLAAHFACELSRRGFKVGLVDADLFGPSIPSLFNLHNAAVRTNEKQELIPIEKNNLKIMSFGFLLGDAPAVMRGPIVTRYIQQILLNTAWGKLDYLFIDMPPGTGDIQLTITQSVRLTGAIIITTPQTLSLLDVARGILMFERVSVPIIGLVDNMSYFICDQCEKKHYIFGENTSETLKNRFGLETLAEIPLEAKFINNLDKLEPNPLIITAVDNIAAALEKLAIQKTHVPEIKFDQKHVYFKWPDKTQTTVSNRDLRLSCRCALCVNELTGNQVFKEKDLKDDIAPKKIIPLGNYAIGIEWNDGHAAGIYPYNNIKEIAQPTKT